jgi:hypothetical protein
MRIQTIREKKKGIHWVHIQRHTQKDFNWCKGLKIFQVGSSVKD